jgi:hypothetical protein
MIFAAVSTSIVIMNISALLRFAGKSLVCLAVAGTVSSCMGYGPRTIERDQMDYGMSISAALQQQLLGNIVRLRYMEAPVFVDVSSVINQYSLSGQVQAGVGFNNSFSSGDTGMLSGGGRWEDRPTITYSPVSGKQFAQSLLTPVPPEALFALVQSGWPARILFRMTVKSINGVEDAVENPVYRKQADPQFRELLDVWSRLRLSGAIGLRRSDVESENASILLYVREDRIDEQTRQDIDFLLTTLRLDPDSKEYKLDYGLIPDEPDEITVLTSSIFDLMLNLAWQVHVPQQHIDEGRTGSTFIDTGLGGPLFDVHYSEDEPEDAFVKIKDRGYWYFIDDRDLTTKRTFGLLQILFSLTDAGEGAQGPVVTIGGGG